MHGFMTCSLQFRKLKRVLARMSTKPRLKNWSCPRLELLQASGRTNSLQLSSRLFLESCLFQRNLMTMTSLEDMILLDLIEEESRLWRETELVEKPSEVLPHFKRFLVQIVLLGAREWFVKMSSVSQRFLRKTMNPSWVLPLEQVLLRFIYLHLRLEFHHLPQVHLQDTCLPFSLLSLLCLLNSPSL